MDPPVRHLHRLPSSPAGFRSTFDRLPFGCLLFMSIYVQLYRLDLTSTQRAHTLSGRTPPPSTRASNRYGRNGRRCYPKPRGARGALTGRTIPTRVPRVIHSLLACLGPSKLISRNTRICLLASLPGPIFSFGFRASPRRSKRGNSVAERS